MIKEQKEKIIRDLDRFLEVDIYLISGLIYGIVYSMLFVYAFKGIRLNLIEGYFQYVVVIFIFIFAFAQADRYFSNMNGIWFIIGIGIFISFVLNMFGINTSLFVAMFFLFIVLLTASFIYYLFRNLLIEKLKLNKEKLVRRYS